MKRLLALLCLLPGGCSTAPVADLLDWVKPGRYRADPKVAPVGGVCQPPVPLAVSDPLTGATIVAPTGGPIIAPPPDGVIPPPAPWPSTGGVPAVPQVPVQPPPPAPPPPPRPGL